MDKIDVFRQLFLNQEINGRLVDEDIFNKALRKCIGDKRLSRRVKKNVPDEEVIDRFVEIEHMESAINSALNLRPKPVNPAVKFDDVRNMDLSLQNWSTYQEAERKFAQERLNAYQEFYALEAPNDILGIYDVIDLEVRMQVIRLYIRLSKKKDEIAEYDEKLKELRQQWSKALEDLNLKKKQRDNLKKPKEDKSLISDQLNALDKSIDELKQDVELEELEEERMLEKRNR